MPAAPRARTAFIAARLRVRLDLDNRNDDLEFGRGETVHAEHHVERGDAHEGMIDGEDQRMGAVGA